MHLDQYFPRFFVTSGYSSEAISKERFSIKTSWQMKKAIRYTIRINTVFAPCGYKYLMKLFIMSDHIGNYHRYNFHHSDFL